MSADRGRERGRPKGTEVRYGPTGKVMRIKSNGYFWSEEAEELFFDALAASCNVSAAANEAGFCTPTVYRLRRRRPEFAAKWQVALAQGYARLETALLQAAIDSLAAVDFDDARPIPRMTVDQAMNVLRAHRHEVAGDGRRGPGARARVRGIEEVRAGILRKVEAIRNAEREERNEARRRKRAAARAGGDAARAEPGGDGAGRPQP